MSTSKKNDKPQMSLGLEYSGNRLLQFLSFRTKKYVNIIEQFSYWRSPLVWLLIFLNVVFAYSLISFVSGTAGIPPEIPLFPFSPQIDGVMFDTSLVSTLVIIFGLTQFIVILISFRLYYKLKDLSQFVLAISALLTVLFFLALYKSIEITLPTMS